MTPPIARITVFIPDATPVSSGRTFSAISVAIAANAKPMPMPSTAWLTQICQGRSWNAASPDAEAATSASPIASGHLKPIRLPRRPATGPANSSITERGGVPQDPARRPAPGMRLAQRHEQCDQGERQQPRAGDVDPRRRLDRRLRHQAVHEDERDGCERRAAEEQPAPAEVVDDQPCEHDAEPAADAEDS